MVIPLGNREINMRASLYFSAVLRDNVQRKDVDYGDTDFQRRGLIRSRGLPPSTSSYLLRALALLPEIDMVAHQGYPFRFVVFSSISLLAGLLYLIGVVAQQASWARETVHEH